MVKPLLSAAAVAAITLSGAHAFQPSRPVALSPVTGRPAGQSFRATTDVRTSRAQRRGGTSISMAGRGEASRPSNIERRGSLFRSTAQQTRMALQQLRRTFAVLLASLAFFLSSTRVVHLPAHAASTAVATSKLTLAQKLNPFRTRSADEMIDAYVRDRLFADDAYDPVESAYREAYADAGGSAGKEGVASGAYPTLLSETAASALGQQKGVSIVASNAASSGTEGKNDGITAVLIKASDFLQNKLRVSASVSYYILAGGGILSICVLPGMLGVLYQGLQRWQIDKSEMKMYGKISDMDATSKKETDDDDDDEEE
ncbi:hypothetical protein ACHAXT_012604 [Thalassiosira profunda]